jgi:hypothetical protein
MKVLILGGSPAATTAAGQELTSQIPLSRSRIRS